MNAVVPDTFAAWRAARQAEVEQALSRFVRADAPAGLGEAMRYAVLDGGNVHFVRHAGGEGYVGDEAGGPGDDARVGADLDADDVTEQAALDRAVVRRRLVLDADARRDVGEGVDLAVRVGEGDADLAAAVLEDEDVSDLGAGAQFFVAVCPDVDEVADLALGHCAERAGVVGRV